MRKLLVMVLATVILVGFYAPIAVAFGTKAECNAALQSGANFYEPKYFGLRSKNPVDGKTKVAAPLEADACVRMLTVAGVQWVPQKTGTVLRWNVNADGSLGEPYARDDCGNPITGISYPQPAPAPSATAEKDKEEVTPTEDKTVKREEPQIIPPQCRKVRAGAHLGFLGFVGLEASTSDSPDCENDYFPSAPATLISYGGGVAPVVAYTGGIAYTGSYGGYHGGHHQQYRPNPQRGGGGQNYNRPDHGGGGYRQPCRPAPQTRPTGVRPGARTGGYR